MSLRIDGPRACTPADLTEVIALVDVALNRPGTGQTFLTDYPVVYEQSNLPNIRILRVDGELAAVVPFVVWPVDFEGCRFSAGNISPTGTAMAHRKKGYGLQCLNDCLRRMEAIGCELSILRTKVETFPFYQCGGYEEVQRQAVIYKCTRADTARFTPHGEDVVAPSALTAAQLAAIQAMHEAEGGGSWRTADRYPLLFSLPKMKTLLAYRGQKPVAYLLVSAAINMPGFVEAGGDQDAVETLLHRAVSELGETEARNAHDNLHPSVIGRVLEKSLPERKQPTAENRMVRINLPTAFFRRLTPWLERENRGVERAFSVGVEGETISFRFNRDGLKLGADRLPAHQELSRRQLAAAVFGQHPTASPESAVRLGDLPAFTFPVWLLDRS